MCQGQELRWGFVNTVTLTLVRYFHGCGGEVPLLLELSVVSVFVLAVQVPLYIAEALLSVHVVHFTRLGGWGFVRHREQVRERVSRAGSNLLLGLAQDRRLLYLLQVFF